MITAKVFDGFSFLKKLAVWKYVLSKRLLAPTAQYLLDRTLEIPRTQADSFIGRWIVSPLLLGEIRKLLADGAGQYEIDKLIRSKQDASSFLSRRDYDPLAYLELCDQTSIDVRLQSTLIEYRNAFMCSEVRGILRSIPDNSVCAVVVGQNHLEGMISNLERGMDFVPESLLSGTSSDDERHSGLIDQFLLALLLDT
jgi:hypothetical protein